MTNRRKKFLKFIFMFLIIFLIYILNISDFKRIVSTNIILEQNSYHTAKYENTYFYFDKNNKKSGIYKMENNEVNQLIYEVDSIDSIAVNQENIFILSNDMIIKLDYSGKEIAVNNLYGNIGSSYLYKNYLYISSNCKVLVVDVNNLNEVNVKNNIDDNINSKINDFKIYTNDEIILIDDNYYSNIFMKDSLNNLLSCNEFYAYSVVLYCNNILYFSMNPSGDIYRYDKDKDEEKIFDVENCLKIRPNNIVNYKNKIIVIQQDYRKKGILINSLRFINEIYLMVSNNKYFKYGSTYEYESEMCIHLKDNLLILNRDTWKELDRIETKSGERIIFADENIFMTYYKNYITKYNINDCSIIEKKKMKHIGRYGTYYFELCKDKIFVYNDEFNVVDIIDID